MPSILTTVLATVQSGLSATFGGDDTLALAQWTDCSPFVVGAVCAGCQLLLFAC